MFKKTLVAIGILVLIAIVVAIFFTLKIATTRPPLYEEVLFSVEPGTGVKTISHNLTQEGFIESPSYFNWYIWLKGWGAKLQAGEYALNKEMSIKQIAQALVGGEALSNEKIIKIIEGWRNSDIADFLEANEIASAEEFSELVNSPFKQSSGCLNPDNCDAYAFLSDAPEEATLEGYLFPDTYRIFKDANVRDIVIKILDNFERKLTPQMREDIAKQNKSVYDIVTMASIIEREVQTAEDMKIVSGIFENRLGIGMALQSDATLSYYLKDKKPSHTLADLEIDTPYNTYKYRGLPPTPISNPGLNAITAAIYPEKTDYLYFLSNAETGESHFARTLDEHNRNKFLYLRN